MKSMSRYRIFFLALLAANCVGASCCVASGRWLGVFFFVLGIGSSLFSLICDAAKERSKELRALKDKFHRLGNSYIKERDRS